MVVEKKPFYTFVKTVFDYAAALVLLVLLSPVFLVLVIMIRRDSPGPAIFTQERLGKNGKIFKIYKLRSMYIDAEKDGAQWAQADDPRMTRIGRILRQKRLDEIPQVLNVLKHEMSFVGPRPERKIFRDEFIREIPDFDDRLAVLPGITGFAQVSGGYDLTPAEKLIYDQSYIKNRSVALDFKILIATIRVIFSHEGAR